MRLCSTSGRYVTSLEIRHFQCHNLAGHLGDESGRAMISSAWEVGSQLSSSSQRLSAPISEILAPFPRRITDGAAAG